MTPVYQTIFDNKRGNCQAAVWASLLHLDLQQVPNFVEFDDDHDALCKFLLDFDYEYQGYIINENRTDLTQQEKGKYQFLKHGLPSAGHIGGFYGAVVYSPGYFDEERFYNDPSYKRVCHAVVVDKDLNIVHDPNPNYSGIKKYPLADVIGYNGVIGVCLYSKKQSNSYVTD
jgi:hypothetical protein